MSEAQEDKKLLAIYIEKHKKTRSRWPRTLLLATDMQKHKKTRKFWPWTLLLALDIEKLKAENSQLTKASDACSIENRVLISADKFDRLPLHNTHFGATNDGLPHPGHFLIRGLSFEPPAKSWGLCPTARKDPAILLGPTY